MGMNNVEELIDHSSHAAKMAGAARAFKLFTEAFNYDIGRKPLRVHVLMRRGEDEINAAREGEFRIARQVARVLLEVFIRAALRRFYKDRSDYGVAHSAGAAHQRKVAFVKRAHRRHQPYSLSA